ncbi:MAG: type II toxin-antitoxin system RelE/ParE family toxin [Synergistaceae bacterium]|nr:type II toxin-antitoxin system RelE/ParE family toxin [Synergistaceae bacterium]
MAILGFADKETEKVYNGHFSRRLPTEIQRMGLIKLVYLEEALTVNDLRVPPSNHLERLHGDREGQYSIRINDKYRICFTTGGNGFDDVEIVDYH